MKTTIYYFEKILNTIKSNGVYIFLSIFFVFLLFIVSDVTNDFLYAQSDKENFHNVFLISFSFLLMAISLWVIPAFFIKMYLGSKSSVQKQVLYFENFEEIYNGKNNNTKNQIPIKYLAIAPWIVYTITLSICYINTLNIFESTSFVFIIILLSSIYVLHFFSKKYKYIYDFFNKGRYRKYGLKALFFIFVLIFLSPLMMAFLIYLGMSYPELDQDKIGDENYVINFYNSFLLLIILYNITCIIMTFIYLVYKENELIDSEQKYKFTKKLHFATFLASVFLIFIFCFLSLTYNLIWISPTVILIVLSTFFILLFELFYTTPRIIIAVNKNLGNSEGKSEGKYDWQKYIFYGAIILVLINFTVIPEKTIYLKDFKNDKESNAAYTDKRSTLEQYFYKWLIYNHNIENKENNEPIDVILISGEGGGSTAGSWILANLLNVESTNPQFYKNIFSLSTVSGSSSGANFYLAIKSQNLLPIEVSNDSIKVDYIDKRRKIVSDIYTKNYFSSNFLGLMFADYFTNPIAAFIKNENIDRNYILQKEEKNALLSATQTDDSAKKQLIEDYFDQNYLDLWYKKENTQGDQLNPLFFINTTFVEEGEKAIFSPVKLDNVNIRAKDVIKEFSKTEVAKTKYIPISAAVAQSQAFPLLSTYNSIPGLGYLGDGGMYENTGTATTLEIYKNLKEFTKNSISKKFPNRKIRFILINFISEKKPAEKSKSLFKKKSMLLFTVGQTLKTPFNGHAMDAQNFLYKEVKKNNADGDKVLYVQNSSQFATTRLISKKTINKMFQYGNSKEKGTDIIINHFKNKAQAKVNEVSEENDDAKVSIVYVHYSNKVNKKLMQNLSGDLNNELNKIVNIGYQEKYAFTSPGIENVPSFDINQIRYFRESDSLVAHRLQKILRDKGFELEIRYFDYKNFSATVPEGQLELWIDNAGNYGRNLKNFKRKN